MGNQKKRQDSEELLTVKEFAESVGVSTQTIYKQLSTRLQTYVVTVGNLKKIKKSAIYEVFKKNDCNQDITNEPTLQSELQILKEQLEQAQEREKVLQSTIDNLTRLLEQQQQLTSQQQALCLADKQKIIELEDKMREMESVESEDHGVMTWFKRLFKNYK